MAKSSIIVTFNSIPSVGTRLRITNDLSATTLSEVFDDIRTFNGVSLIGASTAECARPVTNHPQQTRPVVCGWMWPGIHNAPVFYGKGDCPIGHDGR